MKNAQQLRDESVQAYDNFKSVAQNIASANGVIAALGPVANKSALTGLFQAEVSLNGADTASGNVVLFQQLLSDMLSNLGFSVTFSSNVTSTSVIVDWTEQDS